MDEIEEFYKESMEKAEQDFLEKLKGGMKIPEAELWYKNQLKLLREKYEQRYALYLKDQRTAFQQKKKALGKVEEVKPYEAKHLNLELTKKEKKKIEQEIKKFRRIRKIHNFIADKTPRYLLYLKIKTKRQIKRFFADFKEYFFDFLNFCKNSSISLGLGILNFLKKLASLTKKIFSLLRIFKPKKKDNKEEKKEEKKDEVKEEKAEVKEEKKE